MPPPDPASAITLDNAYVFERSVTPSQGDGTTRTNFIDLYNRGYFVLEAKQGSDQTAEEEAELATLQTVVEQKKAKTKKKKGTAVLGTKAWDVAMFRARAQADRYARALPVEEAAETTPTAKPKTKATKAAKLPWRAARQYTRADHRANNSLHVSAKYSVAYALFEDDRIRKKR